MLPELKRSLFVIFGIISLILGGVGVFLPLLPTTPFLLLASYCFVRSSQRLHDWLMYRSIFSRYLQNYIQYRSVTLWTKIISISALWITITISFILVVNIFARIGLVLVLLGVTIHLARLKVMK